jgi:hypothetical protein
MAALLGLLAIGFSSDLSAKTAVIKSGSGRSQVVTNGQEPAAEQHEAPPGAEERDDADDPPPPVLPTDEELTFDRPRDLNLLTRDQMLSLGEKYQVDIESDVTQVEGARTRAYQSRDLIKLTCIEDKLLQMRLISNWMIPRFKRMTMNSRDELAVRAEFIVIAPNWKRSRELRGEVESCIGETLTSVSVFTVTQEVPPPTGGPDPTEAPGPEISSERVPEASPYR